MIIKKKIFTGRSLKTVSLYVTIIKKRNKYSATYSYSTSNGGGSGSIFNWSEIKEALDQYGIKAIKIYEPIECRFLIDLLFNS